MEYQINSRPQASIRRMDSHYTAEALCSFRCRTSCFDGFFNWPPCAAARTTSRISKSSCREHELAVVGRRSQLPALTWTDRLRAAASRLLRESCRSLIISQRHCCPGNHYNHHRPHRALALNPPDPTRRRSSWHSGWPRFQRCDRLGGVVRFLAVRTRDREQLLLNQCDSPSRTAATQDLFSHSCRWSVESRRSLSIVAANALAHASLHSMKTPSPTGDAGDSRTGMWIGIGRPAIKIETIPPL